MESGSEGGPPAAEVKARHRPGCSRRQGGLPKQRARQGEGPPVERGRRASGRVGCSQCSGPFLSPAGLSVVPAEGTHFCILTVLLTLLTKILPVSF